MTVLPDCDTMWSQYVATSLKGGAVMPEVGVRELKNRTSEIVRAVREARVEYIITYRGRPVARLVPVTEADDTERAWQELDRLSREVSARWQSDKSAVEILAEMRR